MASSVFRSLISFQNAPFYFLFYHYNKGHLKFRFIKCKKQYTADCYLLPFYSQYIYGELSKLFLFILFQDTPEEVHLLLLSIDLRIFSYFKYVLYLTILYFCFSHLYQICFFVVFVYTTFCINFDFYQQQQQVHTPFVNTQLTLPPHGNDWKTDQYWGSENRGEVDLDSSVNCLASGTHMQFTTVPSQCERFPWTWMWRLLYFNHWSNL